MKEDREYLLIKKNKYAQLLGILDIAWLILFIFIIFKFKEANLGAVSVIFLLIISAYSLLFLYFKRSSFTIPHIKKRRPQFFKYYTKYKRFPLVEIIAWAIVFIGPLVFLLTIDSFEKPKRNFQNSLRRTLKDGQSRGYSKSSIIKF